MATKSQLKQYFETDKIPTQAQFGELIDFFMPQSSDDAGERSNQTLKFGQDDEYDSTVSFTAFELTLTRDTNGHFIIGLLKQTEYIVVNGQFRPKITWFSLAGKVLGNMPYYTGSKTFGDIVSFARANLNSNTSEPNLQV